MATCPKCGAQIEPGAVDRQMLAARCRRCRRLVDLAAQLGSASGADGGASTAPAVGGLRGGSRVPVPMPPRFRVDEGVTLKITWRWVAPHFLFLIFFCVFWDGFLVFWYGIAFTAGSGTGGVILPMVLFPLIHVAVGLGLSYYTICGFVNSTVVEAGNGRLTIRHGPLPWRGNYDLDVGSLDQLYSEERIHRGKHGSIRRTYEVCAVDRDGVSKTLLRGLQRPAEALWIEQRLEGHLGIADRAVGGELPR